MPEQKIVNLIIGAGLNGMYAASLLTARGELEVGLFEGISLYRRSADPGFSRQEILTKQSLFPLLSRTWHHNQIQQLRLSGQEPAPGAAAVCDSLGWLRHAEDEFVALLRGEFPGWRPPELPAPLRSWLEDSAEGVYRGRGLDISRSLQDDLILLQARSKGALAELTQRESQVAELYAAGLTYKEIAADLGLAASTVRRHLESIYHKLEIASKVELVQLFN